MARFACQLVLGVMLAAGIPATCLAWGELGHRVVAEIALRHMSERAIAESRLLLGGPDRFVDLSMWADEFRDDNAYTYPWHVVDIPIDAMGYDRARDCGDGRCVVEKIKDFAVILAEPRMPLEARADALVFLIHLVGDIHNPFHTVETDMWVSLDGKAESLHLWWDNEFPEALGSDEVEVADRILEQFAPDERRQWAAGTPEEWAEESLMLTRGFVTTHGLLEAMRDNMTSPDNPIMLPSAVLDEIKPVVARRLAMGGVRLAWLLDHALR